MQLQTHFYLQNQPHRLDHVRTASRLFQCDYHYTLDKKLNNQMLHKKLVCCNVFLHLSFVQPNCSEIKKSVQKGNSIFIIMRVLCRRRRTPTPHTASLRVWTVSNTHCGWEMDYGSRETECSHGDGQSTVVVAMRRVLAASVVCVSECCGCWDE